MGDGTELVFVQCLARSGNLSFKKTFQVAVSLYFCMILNQLEQLRPDLISMLESFVDPVDENDGARRQRLPVLRQRAIALARLSKEIPRPNLATVDI